MEQQTIVDRYYVRSCGEVNVTANRALTAIEHISRVYVLLSVRMNPLDVHIEYSNKARSMAIR